MRARGRVIRMGRLDEPVFDGEARIAEHVAGLREVRGLGARNGVVLVPLDRRLRAIELRLLARSWAQPGVRLQPFHEIVGLGYRRRTELLRVERARAGDRSLEQGLHALELRPAISG